MAERHPPQPVPQQDLSGTPSRRLLKTWQDPTLIRRMDVIILASRGAYADRHDFIAEALGDRIEAEEELRGLSSAELEVGSIGGHHPLPAVTGTVRFGDWLGKPVPTGAPTPGPDANFGLHNRDYPTLWAADWLGRLTAERGQALRWNEFVTLVTEHAWVHAATLEEAALARSSGAKLAAGFPTNPHKREASEARFRDHALGMVTSRAVRGPLFVFRLVCVQDAMTTLSAPALRLLPQLHEAGVDGGPPFSAAAWSAFSEYLGVHAPVELRMWRRVLRVITEHPDRGALVRRCDWWSGSTADTNVMGYVARGREWGLIELGMQDGRYALTQLGEQEIERDREVKT